MLRPLVVLLASGLLAASCTVPATEVLVAVNTDADPAGVLVFRATVYRGAMTGTDGATQSWTRGGAVGTTTLPASFAVIPSPGGTGDTTTLVIDAQYTPAGGGATATFRRVARFPFTLHQRTLVSMFLSVRCADPSTSCQHTTPCTVSAYCEEQGLTCGDQGTCVPQAVQPTQLDRDSDPLAMVRDVTAPDVAADAMDVFDATDTHDVVAEESGACGDGSIDFMNDPHNCGSCGNVCAQACSHGACVTVTRLARGDDQACVVLSDGTVRCWGSNNKSVLGLGGITFTDLPTEVPGVSNVTDITIGHYATLATRSDGSVLCWGSNDIGQCGDGTTASRDPTSPPVSALMGMTHIRAGFDLACGVAPSGHLQCWGANFSGQLGDGTLTARATPADVSGPVVSTTFGVGNDHACAIDSTHRVLCWGAATQAQVGMFSGVMCPYMSMPNPCLRSPTAVPSLSATLVASHGDFSCAITTSGTVVCWGVNDTAQIGATASGATATPNTVSTASHPQLLGAVELELGESFAMARLGDGTLWAWGGDNDGQLGNGSTGGPIPAAAQVLTMVASAAAGGDDACALSPPNLYCWGKNTLGQVGPSTSTQIPTPRLITW